MNKQAAFLPLLLFISPLATQDMSGEYYLQGVMETASGFKLNTDSSFEFFFSHGALDRFGRGRWTLNGSHIALNSPKRTGNDFVIDSSTKTPAGGLTLKLKGDNNLSKYVYARVVEKGKTQDGTLENDGKISFAVNHPDTIELTFEFCAEKTSIFTSLPPEHNYFEFRMEPTIMEYFFDNFKLEYTGRGLAGAHPLIQGKKFHYEKSSEN